jgi:fatty-acyl-CoA synthase
MMEVRQSLFETLQAQAERRGQAPAVTVLNHRLEPTTWTFSRLSEAVTRLAREFERSRLPPHSLVGILSPAQDVQVLHYLAALAAGLVPAILTPPNRKLNLSYYRETTARVLAQCPFAAIVTDVDGLAMTARRLAPFALRASGAGPAADGHEPLPDSAFLQFSSGTTGIKRGVVVTHAAALQQLQTYGAALELNERDCIVSWLPLYHDMGLVACLLLPLAWGAHVVMLHPLDWVAQPVSFLRAVSRHRGTLAWNPNFAYAFMADRTRAGDLAGLNLQSLRGLVNCAEPVTRDSQAHFVRRFQPCGLRSDVFFGCYAMAETTYALTHGRPLDTGTRLSVGRPLPGVELAVCDDTGASVPDGTIGELRVRSPFNAVAYHADPEATTAAFRDGWYVTGDLGYRAAGEFFVCGRKKDVIIVGGANVFPEDIEGEVSRVIGVHPGRVAVFSDFDDVAQTERITILAEPADRGAHPGLGAEIQQRVLAAFQVANFSVHLVEPGWLVKSSSGKMARTANRQKWARDASRLLADDFVVSPP